MSARPPFIEHTDSAWLAGIRRAEANRVRLERELEASARQLKAADQAARAAARRARGSVWLTRWNDKREQLRPWGTDDVVTVLLLAMFAFAALKGWVFGPLFN